MVVAAEEEMAEMALEEAVVAPAEVGAAAVDEPKVSKKIVNGSSSVSRLLCYSYRRVRYGRVDDSR